MRTNHPALRTVTLFASTALAVALASPQAQAHWCDDLWSSSYNITVKPETATVTVPATGSATLNVYVQNNMSWPLPGANFSVSMTGGQVTAKLDDTPNKSGSFMPGETFKYVLTINKTGGGEVKATDITFGMKFSGNVSPCYPCGGKSTATVSPDGTVGSTAGIGSMCCAGNGAQASDIVFAALADFETSSGIDKLMGLYCSGRGSYGSPANCSGATTKCPAAKSASGNGSKFDHPHLGACIEIAARKAALGDKLPVARARFMCGAAADKDATWGGLPLFALGYLGDDPDARKFMQGMVDDATFGLIAKAALYVAGNAADKTTYGPDVKAGLTGGSFHGKMACAAALGIADKDDAAVKTVLMPATGMIYPEADTKGLYANHLLELVAWDRRGWAPKGNDRCGVSFYGDTTFPGATCGGGPGTGGTPTGGTTGTAGAPAAGGTTGTAGTPAVGGSTGAGGTAGAGGTSVTAGTTGTPTTTGGSVVSSTGGGGGKAGNSGAGGKGGNSGSTGGNTGTTGGGSSGCNLNLGARGETATVLFAVGFMAIWVVARRRRR